MSDLIDVLRPFRYSDDGAEQEVAREMIPLVIARPIDRPQLVVCAVDADRAVALDAARLLVTQYLGQQPHIMKASGVPDSVLDDVHGVLSWPATHEQVVAASKFVPDDIVQMICAAGSAAEVREKVAEYVAHGCTCPVLYPLGDVELTIDTFSAAPPPGR